MEKRFPTLGCCGLDCGLCPRYYTEGSSRCPGCGGRDFSRKHPSCSFLSCCGDKQGLEVCALCTAYPCFRFDKETGETDSFVTHRRVLQNQQAIRQSGLDAFMLQQNERIKLLTAMLRDFDDGRCKSLYCLAAALLSPGRLRKALAEAERQLCSLPADSRDTRTAAKCLKDALSHAAAEEGVELKLRKPGSKPL